MQICRNIIKHYNIKLIKSVPLQILSIVLYLHYLIFSKLAVESSYQLGWINFVIQVAIMVALSMLLAPKPKRPKGLKPVSLEGFDIPTAEEGRCIQVLFGKKYVAAPNVVWFGNLKVIAVKD